MGKSRHITSSVFINDDEPGLHHDFARRLEKLAPFNPDPNPRDSRSKLVEFFRQAIDRLDKPLPQRFR